jgi:hypothetical protein
MLDKALMYLMPLAGVALGFILNEASYWLRIRRDDRKKIKGVLYNLLEIFNELYSSYLLDVNKELFIKKYISKLPLDTDEQRKFLYSNLKEIIEKLYKQLAPADKLEKIKSGYLTAINSLASIDPLLAYKVSGKSSIMEYIATAISEIDRCIKNLSSEEEPQVMEVKDEVIDKISAIIEEDIKEVSWKINILTWYRSKQIIHYIKEEKRIEAQEEMDQMINKVVAKFLGSTK